MQWSSSGLGFNFQISFWAAFVAELTLAGYGPSELLKYQPMWKSTIPLHCIAMVISNSKFGGECCGKSLRVIVDFNFFNDGNLFFVVI